MDEFEAMRRLAVTLGVACPESSEGLFTVTFINSLKRAATRNIKEIGRISNSLKEADEEIERLSDRW